MEKQLKFSVVLSAIDKMSGVVNSAVSKSVKKMEKMQQATQRFAMGAAGLAAGLGAAVAAPVKAFADAEDAAVRLKTTMMDSTGAVSKDFAALDALANKLGSRLPGTTADFQNMLAKLVQQGISSKAILGGVGEAAAYIGVQMKMPFEEAAEFAAKLQDATKTSEKDMLALMDTIQKSYNLGVDSNNMLQGFSKLSSAMDVIKLKGLEGANALAPLLVMADQAGMAGESAGNAYRKVFQSVFDAKKMDKANSILQGKGIKSLTFTTKKGEFGGLDNFIKQLERLKKLDTQSRIAVIKELFGDDAETQQVVSLMIDKGLDGYNETLRKMQGQASLQQRVNAQLGTLKNLWDAATGSLTNVLASIGELAAPELAALTKWLSEFAETAKAWIAENPKLVKAFALIAGGVAAVSAALAVLGFAWLGVLQVGTMAATGFGLVAGALGFLAKSVMFVVNVIRYLTVVMMTNPILAIIAAIAIAAYLIYDNWEYISEFFSKHFGWVADLFNAFLEKIRSLGTTFYEVGKSIMTALVDGLKSMLAYAYDTITAPFQYAASLAGYDISSGAVFGGGGTGASLAGAAAGGTGSLRLSDTVAGRMLNGTMPQPTSPTANLAKSAPQTNSLNYSPNITIQGNATPEQQAEFRKMLNDNKNDMMRVWSEMQKRANEKQLK